MSHYVPYLLLSVAAVSTLAYLSLRTRSYYTLVLFLAVSGMIYVFEYVVLILLHAYRYKPMVFHNSTFDSVFGALVSNLLAVPSIAAAFVILRLRKPWLAVFPLLLTGIEWLFIKLDVFLHDWWRLPYTTAGIATLLGVAWYLNKKVVEGNRFFRFMLLLMFTFCMIETLAFTLSLAGFRLFEPGIFQDRARDDTFFAVPYAFLKALLITSAVYWARKIYPLLGALLVILLLTLLTIRLDIAKLFISEWLFYVIYSILCLFWGFAAYGTMRWLRRRLSW